MRMAHLGLLGLHILSVICMLYGWFLPIMDIDIFAEVPILGRYYFLKETRSIAGTLAKLWQTGHALPAGLIFIFGMLLPGLKALVLPYALFTPQPPARLIQAIGLMSKWAMADVFALGVFIAYLAANALGQTQASLGPGYYFFVAFVGLGLVSSKWLGSLTGHYGRPPQIEWQG
ncbi:MAG TPA: paraquat-inducible protein A [Phnomibacter sp.]|nr:paraquat-inducible protein A [Phnomibacter sp.]